MTKHTPGPWATDDNPNCGDGLNIRDSKGRRLAHTSAVRNLDGKFLSQNGRIEADEARANASLIAAAPDLLDVLVLALPYVECAEDDPAYKPGAVLKMVATMRAAIARAAIARAEGSTS